MTYPFGKDLTYNFYAISDNNDYESLPDSPESIYIYKTGYKPSRAQALAGTDNGGLLETIASWSDTSDSNGKTFTIAALDDPDVSSEVRRFTYYVALNFKLSAGEQTQTVIRALPMERVLGHHKAVSTAAADLEAIYTDIDSLRSEAQQATSITLATNMMKDDLTASGFEWVELWRPDELNQAIAYRALADIMLGLITSDSDEWHIRYLEYKETWKGLYSMLKLEYDSTKDGEPDIKEAPQSFRRITV